MKNRLIELDALRGIAAIFVVVFHYVVTIGGSDALLLRGGVTGVELFFLISGYVIFMTLSKTESSYNFIISRLSRLYPAYLVMMSLTLMAIFFLDKNDMPGIKAILGNLTMMQPILFVSYIDQPYWTLTVEMQFYILMLCLYMTRQLRYIEYWGIIGLTFILIYYFIAGTFFSGSVIYITPRSLFPLISHLQLFFAGILFYNMQSTGIKPRHHIMLLFCLLITIYIFDKSGRSHFFIDRISYTIIITLYFGLFYLLVFGKLQWLKLKVFTFLGSISYSLYLIHQRAGRMLYLYLIPKWRNPPITLLVIFILMIITATAVTYWIEKPAIANLRKALLRKRPLEPVLERSSSAAEGVV